VSTFSYDAEGNLVSRTDPAGSATFTYDVAGRLTEVTDPLTSQTATFSYTTTGELAGVNPGTNKPRRWLTYDNLGRLSSDAVKMADGSIAASQTYTYDQDDLVTSRTTSGFAGGGSNQYGYDGLRRLTSWTRSDTQQVTYGYDAASNRTSVTGPDGTRTVTYDARNRLVDATGGGQPDLTNTSRHGAPWSPRQSTGRPPRTRPTRSTSRSRSARRATPSTTHTTRSAGWLSATASRWHTRT